MRDTHSRPVPGGRGFWWTDSLWAAAAELTPHEVALSSIDELDTDCWFDGQAPTIRQVAEHARRIQDADFSHPVILASDGTLMDGGHRLAKAWLDGRATLSAVRFEVDPPPDWIGPPVSRG